QAEGSQRAASLVTGEDGQPGIVTHRYGGGEGIYVAFAAGQQSCHVVNYLGSRGGTWTAPPARELHDVMLWAVGAKAARPLRRVSVPPGVVTNVLTQRTADGERLVVHLLNLQLTEVGPDGAEIDKGTEVVYPWVERPLVFDLRVDGPCHARMLSPDFDGVWHLDARPAPARGFTRITVPELARYALICVEPGEADEPPGASQQHGDRDFEIAGGVRLTGAWRDEGMVQRPIGSRPCACRQFAHPAEAPAAPGGAVQVDIPVPVDAADGLQLRFWESDLCRDATGGRGLFRKLLLVNGREVSCRPMLGDGSWIEHRVDIAEAVGPDATNVISLRVENTGETSPAGQVRVCEMLYTTGRWQLWRGERRVRDLDLPQG
ncbi:MAG: hypothetical protein U9R79_18205, partial [Armatimonadota bacterium]|nr:hypothetical protein [Armatimonadota bacterium]